VSDRVLPGLSDDEPPMLSVRLNRLVDWSVSEFGEGDTFPRAFLTDVVGELRRGEAASKGPKQTSGVDLRQLAVVTYEDQLPLSRLDQVRDGGELAGTDHASLIDHHHNPRGKTGRATGLVEESGQRAGRNPGGGFETGRRPGRERRTQDRGACQCGELADHRHHSGLVTSAV